MEEENEYVVIPLKRKDAKERNVRKNNIIPKIHSDKEGWGGGGEQERKHFFGSFSKISCVLGSLQ